MTSAPLHSAVVVGGGAVALLSAIALKRSSPRTTVQLVSAPITPTALADTTPLLPPAMLRLHETLGIDERGLLRRAGASHWLTTNFDGFARRPFTIGFGAPPQLELDPEATGLAAALAAANRFGAPSDDHANPLADLDYGMRIAPEAYRQHLASLARHLKVEIAAADIVDLERECDGSIVAIALSNGARLTANLFIDASGADAILHRGDRQSWADRLPFNRLIAAEPQPPALRLSNMAVATGDAYLLLSPGRDATWTIMAYRGDAEGAASALLDRVGATPAFTARLAVGRVNEAWCGNVIAVSDAAASIEPVGGMALHLAARQIALLIETLPAPPSSPAIRREYNRRAALIADTTADYVALHHARLPLVRSDSLARTLDLYERRGHVARWGEDAVPRDLWQQLLAGVVGARADAPADALAGDVRDQRMRAAARRVDAGVAAAAPYPSWLGAALEGTR